MTQFNVTVFSGTAYTVEKRNVYRNETLSVPEGSVLLSAEPVWDDKNAVEVLEVWIGIPQDAVIQTETVRHDTVDLPPAQEVPVDSAFTQLPDDAYELEETSDEYYTDY